MIYIDGDNMISIIVPVYNAEKFVRNTIENVLSQTYSDWELILVDDKSTDKSVEIINEILQSLNDKRIKLITLNENVGAAKARNIGLDKATGRYIAFLDADDIWDKNKLSKQIKFMIKHNAGFSFTAYEYGDENAVPTGKTCRVPKTLNFREALGRTIIFTTTVMIDTEIVDKKLIYMPKIGSEDTATWWNILKTGITAYGLNELLAIYRRPGNSLSSDKKLAVKRIWNLYRKIAGLSLLSSIFYMFIWAWNASLRRIIPDTKR